LVANSVRSAADSILDATDIRQRPLRVLVVDDQPDTVITLLELLRQQGYVVEGFASGREALKGVQRFEPDVVISDIAMPVPNGWDIAREVRYRKGQDRPLLIAISGVYTNNSDQKLAHISGFDFCLTKPCDPQVLMALVERARPAKP
jgi:CheY-like chemotaxis protein